MPTTTRRTHKKSRHGCQQCKRNRTKCDESRPNCGRCARIGLKCSLIDPSSALIIINALPPVPETATSENVPLTPPSSAPASAPPSVASPPDMSIKSLDTRTESKNSQILVSDAERQRLKLMNHYNRFTALSLSQLTLDTEEGRAIWRYAVPELALQNDFLLHGLLSISALHLALCDPSQQHENSVLAVEHHNRGLALFTPHLQDLDPANIDALFAFACMTALHSFGIHLNSGSQFTPLKKIHEVFTLMRGTGIFVRSAEQQLAKGIWKPWFGAMAKDECKNLPPMATDVFTRLTARIESTITTSSQREMYLAAIEALKTNLTTAAMLASTHMSIVLFPVMSPPGFIEMVCLAEPLALAILANWAVVLHWYRGHIWAQDWGKQTIKAVQEVLPANWHDCIAWALDELESTEERPCMALKPTRTTSPNITNDSQSPVPRADWSIDCRL